MRKRFTYLTSFVLFVSLVSCSTIQPRVLPPSATPSGPRTIVLGGIRISEVDVKGLTSWYCQDYINGEQTLVEVGFFGDSNLEGSGFILHDGGYSGEITLYQHEGLEHNWYWGPNESDYQFMIKTDGTGVYYDFSRIPVGEKTKPNAIYKCYKR